MELVAEGEEVEWFGIWDDEKEKKRVIESERAECRGTSAESWGAEK